MLLYTAGEDDGVLERKTGELNSSVVVEEASAILTGHLFRLQVPVLYLAPR